MGGALGSVLLVAAGAVLVLRPDVPVPVVPEAAAPVGAIVEPELPEPRPAPSVAGAPQRIVVPALGVDVPVDPIRTVDDVLVPPTDPRRIGWWADGARPGANSGTALVTGHTVHTGGGALDDLEDLESGDEVSVRTDRGLVRYAVESVETIPADEVARRRVELFDQEGPGRLVIVTCEDWDGTRYLSSVVVTAEPLA